MKTFLVKAKRRRSLFLASAIAPMCLGVLLEGPGPGPSRLEVAKPARLQSLSASDVTIINKTTTLDVTVDATAGNRLVARLRNVSSRDLNGYVVAVNDGRITADLSSGNQVITSGQSDELDLPIRSSPMTLTILAAMFADGTIEADGVLKSELTEWRLGLKRELARGLLELNAILDSPDVFTAKALNRLDSRLSLPLDSDTHQSHLADGTRHARISFNSDSQSLRERAQHRGTAMQRQRLLDLKGRIERRIASL